ncbi:Demethylmenaquinone methyltransferase protein [Dioscorea alata]|uniref:Demethylmenaquinone methyltransferase protein n=1 Tax=Dioscorea alata TaxID=55571 RepID=A0ACB7TXF7_DIOAL|nr:Demethylmenaquinone methyltransferase protein [Dioscorea alata]
MKPLSTHSHRGTEAMGGLELELPCHCFIRAPKLKGKPILPFRIRATASTSTIVSNPDLIQDANASIRMKVLACPICFDALFSKTGASISLASTSGSSVECNTCKKGYRGNDAYLDLTLSGSSMDYDETMPAATELFRSPLVSFLYERGWRQNFVWGGFPGPEREFEMAKDFLKPTFGGTIIDASCGSGLFSRLFAKSELYSLVVALDYSENMLRQCYEFTNQDNISKENLLLIRADISRLPFIAGSIDAVHAGAALHCWPSPSAAVAEISRVLRPGGVFVATTFILDTISIAVPVLRIIRQPYIRATSNNIFLSEDELEDLCKACGLTGFSCMRNGPFVMITATKPG